MGVHEIIQPTTEACASSKPTACCSWNPKLFLSPIFQGQHIRKPTPLPRACNCCKATVLMACAGLGEMGIYCACNFMFQSEAFVSFKREIRRVCMI